MQSPSPRALKCSAGRVQADMEKKTIRVVAAVLFDSLENPTRVFATQRGYGEQKGGWEFPGGKLEKGETAEEALCRELREELEIEVVTGALLGTVEYDYPKFHLSMDCICGEISKGEPVLKEAMAARWLTAETLPEVEWLPADRIILPKIAEILQKSTANP